MIKRRNLKLRPRSLLSPKKSKKMSVKRRLRSEPP